MNRQCKAAEIKRTECKARKLDRNKVKELHEKGLSSQEIATHQGVNPSTVWRFLQQTEAQRQQLSKFKSSRHDCLANLHGKALEVQDLALDRIKADLLDDRIADALSPTAKTQYLTAAGVVGGISFDKERLERGESTQNHSIVSTMVDARVGSLYKRTPGVKPPKGTEADKEPPHEG